MRRGLRLLPLKVVANTDFIPPPLYFVAFCVLLWPLPFLHAAVTCHLVSCADQYHRSRYLGPLPPIDYACTACLTPNDKPHLKRRSAASTKLNVSYCSGDTLPTDIFTAVFSSMCRSPTYRPMSPTALSAPRTAPVLKIG